MTIKVGSARIDEKGNISGGTAGDQNKKEVATQNGYIWSGGWDCCIRIKNEAKRKKYIAFIKWACANELIGYDQKQRMTLYNALKALDFDYKKLTKRVECDCSSLVACGLIVSGYTKINPSCTTRNLESNMKSNYPTSFTFFDYKYKNGDHTKISKWWRNGDILNKRGHHVVTVISGGNVPTEKVGKEIPDVSNYHHVTDWSKIKANCPFIIGRATQGSGSNNSTNLVNSVDKYLDTFIKGCEKNKIPYWLYVYLDKGNELAQAKYMLKVCKPKVGSYFRGYILDVEAGNSATNVKEALTWLSKQTDKCMFYTYYGMYNKYKSIITNLPSNCAYWEARTGKNTGYFDPSYPCHKVADLHQYTSKGTCEGISGKCDLNMIVSSKKKLSWFTSK